MTKIAFSNEQLVLMERAVRYMISNLQYERHQACKHGCNPKAYDEEIEQYKQFKQYILDNERAEKDRNKGVAVA